MNQQLINKVKKLGTYQCRSLCWESNNNYGSSIINIPNIKLLEISTGLFDKNNISAHVIEKRKKLRNIGCALAICTNKHHADAMEDGLETRIYFKYKDKIIALLVVYNDILSFGIYGRGNKQPKFYKKIFKWAISEDLIKEGYRRIKDSTDFFNNVVDVRKELYE